MRFVASFDATVEVTGECASFAAVVDELHTATDDPDSWFVAAVETSYELEEAVLARVRWNRAWLTFEGQPLLSARYGDIELSSELVPGQFRTMKFRAAGPEWGLPSVSHPMPPYLPCDDPLAELVAPYRRLWGNREVAVRFAVGKSTAHMPELKVFGGLTLQKADAGDIMVAAEINCVDLSLRIADAPLCYGLQPFSGKRRGQVMRELALSIGIPNEKIFVPLGGVMTKAMVLNNLTLLPFAAEFGQVENWFSFIDEDGNFVTEEIALKTEQPDFVHDASLGDLDLNTFQEVAPDQPPDHLYITAAFPVKSTNPDENPLSVTELAIVSEFGYYNPLCVMVRPSGLPSYAQLPDGAGVVQYRAFPAQVFMEIARTETERTTIDGVLVHEVIKEWAFYNPLAYDPTYDSSPASGSHAGAYGDKTFHRDEVESLMIVSEEVTDNALDEFGTLLGIRVVKLEWYAPKRAITYNSPPRNNPQNKPLVPSYIYPESKGVTARQTPVEVFQVVEITQRDENYSPEGTLVSQSELRYRITAPTGRSDYDDGVAGVPPTITPALPLPTQNQDPVLTLELTGPTRQAGDRFFFQLSMPGWVDAFLTTRYGQHPKVLTLLSPTQYGFPALTFVPRGGADQRILPGTEGQQAQYAPGQVIDPEHGKLTAEIYVDLPHSPPYVPYKGFGGLGGFVGTNLFDGNVNLFVAAEFEADPVGPLLMRLVPATMPKRFTAYKPGSSPGRGI